MVQLVSFSQTAANSGKIVIMSALNSQYTQVSFPSIAELIPLCEKVKKLSSICKMCSHTANFTFRTAKDSDKMDDLIGGAEAYMPLCRECLDFKKQQKLKQQQKQESVASTETLATKLKIERTPFSDISTNTDMPTSNKPKTEVLTSPDREIRKYNDQTRESLRSQI